MIANAPDDQRFMALALALGRRGQGQTGSNPAVGCVLVSAGRVVGRGWTQQGGRPHAERVALDQAGERAQGATAYVTLEPCAHHGVTAPCAEALIAAGVTRVVAAVQDPDPRVSGQGFAMLRAAGLAVSTGVMEAWATRDLEGFLKRITTGRARLTLKLAKSFDGRIATGTGQSVWITGPEARRVVHAMRARHDAVMVGGGTARLDDPALTVRDLGPLAQPARVVVSRRLDLPLTGQLAQTAGEVPVILCHGANADASLRRAWEARGATLITCETRDGQVDLIDVLERLADHGINSVLCEGGGTLAASLIEADLVDRLVGFDAGLSIGAEGLPSIGALGLGDLKKAPRYALRKVQRVGNDIWHEWERR